MNGGYIDMGTLNLPAANTAYHSTFNLNGGTVNIRQESYGYGTTEALGLYIGESGQRNSKGYTGKLNLSGGTLICGGNLMTTPSNNVSWRSDVTGDLIARYVNTEHVIAAYPNLSSTTYHKYVVWDYDSRNSAKTTITGAFQLKKEAYQPSPINGERFAAIAPVLRWYKGNNGTADANDHSVYFGTASSGPGLVFKGKQSTDSNSYSPGTLEVGKTYYWRIDEGFPTGTGQTGPVWSFTVAGRSRDPNPAIGALVSTPFDGTLVLSWTKGLNAASHAVYLGTNSASLPNIFTGTSTTYTLSGPNQPAMDKTYYWRVDESNSTGYTGAITGDIWNFKTALYHVVDDIESYPTNFELGERMEVSKWC